LFKDWILTPLLKRRGANFFPIALALLIFSAWPYFRPPTLPSQEAPFTFYSNQTEHNLEKTILASVEKAKKKIVLSTFGEVDLDLLTLLKERHESGIEVILHYDAKSFPKFLRHELPYTVVGHKEKGLMHQKIVAIDDEFVVLGSTNLTYSSYKIHDNFLMGIFSTALSEKIVDQLSNPNYPFLIEETFHQGHLTFWSLPGMHDSSLQNLIDALNGAANSINCMVFTFTHPKLLEALVAAHRRGVLVEVTIDKKSAKGASKEVISRLRSQGISVYVNNHQGLMHHKMCLIDKEIFFFGSANWTKSAFEKNRDYLVRIDHLDQETKDQIVQTFEGSHRFKKLSAH
jgi:phosphatidylserine/phosphatidylglycerophosphate/cardiolipin synthase-like enzyme